MKLPRRHVLQLGGAIAAATALAGRASALDYPMRPVHLKMAKVVKFFAATAR
jgi:hypothetical protein